MPWFTLRLASIDDMSTLLNIEQVCFSSDRLSKRQFRYLLKQAKALTWVIELEGEVYGYCLVLLPKAPRPARIYSLAVLPAYQGKGLANSLIAHVLHEVYLRHYKACVLEVRESDIPTIRLYEKHGFIIKKRLENYYEDKQTALSMRKLFESNNCQGKTTP